MQTKVSYGMILKIKRALFCMVTVIFALIFSVFIEAFLTEHLIEINFSKETVGFFFAIFASMYTIMAFAVGPLTKKFSSRKVSFISYLLIAAACFIFGPSYTFHFDKCLRPLDDCEDAGFAQSICDAAYDLCIDNNQGYLTVMTVVGLLVLGAGTGSVVVPILIELVTSIKETLGPKVGA